MCPYLRYLFDLVPKMIRLLPRLLKLEILLPRFKKIAAHCYFEIVIFAARQILTATLLRIGLFLIKMARFAINPNVRAANDYILCVKNQKSISRTQPNVYKMLNANDVLIQQ